ncbi:hypothetical protein Pelo_13967 [Pelomyxa schiedti]|nr:hypothetical protein Pelo_13967 [Pelomyxa schiedti]
MRFLCLGGIRGWSPVLVPLAFATLGAEQVGVFTIALSVTLLVRAVICELLEHSGEVIGAAFDAVVGTEVQGELSLAVAVQLPVVVAVEVGELVVQVEVEIGVGLGLGLEFEVVVVVVIGVMVVVEGLIILFAEQQQEEESSEAVILPGAGALVAVALSSEITARSERSTRPRTCILISELCAVSSLSEDTNLGGDEVPRWWRVGDGDGEDGELHATADVVSRQPHGNTGGSNEEDGDEDLAADLMDLRAESWHRGHGAGARPVFDATWDSECARYISDAEITNSILLTTRVFAKELNSIDSIHMTWNKDRPPAYRLHLLKILPATLPENPVACWKLYKKLQTKVPIPQLTEDQMEYTWQYGRPSPNSQPVSYATCSTG